MQPQEDGTGSSAERSVPTRKSDDFLSLASHELRTPLSIVKWYSEMLLDGDCGALNEDQTKYLRTIQASNQRAIDLIRSLLNISRLDLGTFGINPMDIDLRFIVKQVLTERKTDIALKKITIQELYEGAIPGMLPTFQADKQMCLVIVRNIISNAILFSKEEGTIEIRILTGNEHEQFGGKTISEESLVLMIKDNGIGIPEGDKASIFSKLFKGSNVGEVDSSGAGLGLYIVKLILSKVGGEVWFESLQGVGTTFFVAFPRRGMDKKVGRTTLD